MVPQGRPFVSLGCRDLGPRMAYSLNRQGCYPVKHL